jgi:hypothetical protein
VLGPPAGRYVIRDHADEGALRVLVLTELGAAERRLLGGSRRKPREVEPEAPPTPVTTTRATIVRGQPVQNDEEARAFMTEPDDRVAADLDVLNHVLHLHRIASADDTVRHVGREQSLVVRIGYGEGDDVAHGRWIEAVDLPEPKTARRGRREAALRPQERLAALLGGRDAALACEELTLRARHDLDYGRVREAALQLRVALEAALAELEAWRERGDLADRIEELREERGAVGDAANAALRGGLDEPTIEDVERVLGRIEAALRARTAAGFGA